MPTVSCYHCPESSWRPFVSCLDWWYYQEVFTGSCCCCCCCCLSWWGRLQVNRPRLASSRHEKQAAERQGGAAWQGHWWSSINHELQLKHRSHTSEQKTNVKQISHIFPSLKEITHLHTHTKEDTFHMMADPVSSLSCFFWKKLSKFDSYFNFFETDFFNLWLNIYLNIILICLSILSYCGQNLSITSQMWPRSITMTF